MQRFPRLYVKANALVLQLYCRKRCCKL